MYSIGVSSNLISWRYVDWFRSYSTVGELNWLVLDPSQESRFFRVARVTPDNDDFANRIMLTGRVFTFSGFVGDSRFEPDDPFVPCPGHMGVWYSWTAPAAGRVLFRVDSSDPEAGTYVGGFNSVWEGTNLSTLEFVADAHNSTNFAVNFDTIAGKTYELAVNAYQNPLGPGRFTAHWIFSVWPEITLLTPTNTMRFVAPAAIPLRVQTSDVDGEVVRVDYATDGGAFRLTSTNAPFSGTFTNVTAGFYTILATATDDLGVSTTTSVNIHVVPANDDFTNRIAVTGTNLLLRGGNSAATREPVEPFHAGLAGQNSVWWSWTAPRSGPVTIATTPTSLDPLLAVYTGGTLASLSLVAADHVSGGTGRSTVSFNAVAGTAYQIAVDSKSAPPFTFTGTVRVTVIMP